MGKNYPQLRTSEKLAKEYGVSEKTIRNDAVFAQSIDKIVEEVGEDAKQKILKGDLSQKDVKRIANSSQIKKEWYQSSKSLVWETPQWLFDILNDEFHFELDVCALSITTKVPVFYSLAE